MCVPYTVFCACFAKLMLVLVYRCAADFGGASSLITIDLGICYFLMMTGSQTTMLGFTKQTQLQREHKKLSTSTSLLSHDFLDLCHSARNFGQVLNPRFRHQHIYRVTTTRESSA